MIDSLLNLFYTWNSFLQFSAIIILSGFLSFVITSLGKSFHAIITVMPILLHGWPQGKSNTDIKLETVDDKKNQENDEL